MLSGSDPVPQAARGLFYLGVATIPAIAIRFGQFTVSDLIFLLALPLVAATAALQKGERHRVDRAWLAAAGITAFGAALSSLNAISVSETVETELRMLFLLIALPWLASHLLTTPERIERTLNAFVLGCCASAVVAVMQVFFGLFLELSETNRYGRAVGLSQHPNDAGGSLALGFVLAFVALQRGGHLHRRRRQSVLTLIGAGIILSGSVTGVLAALAGVLLAYFIGGITVGKLVRLGAVLVFTLVVALGLQAQFEGTVYEQLSPLERLSQTTSGSTATGNTLDSRIETDRSGINGILDEPVTGHGLDGESTTLPDIALSPHNLFILAWYGGGIMFLIGVVIAAWAPIRRARRSPPEPLRNKLLVAAGTAFVFSLTAPIMYQRYFWLPFVLLVAWLPAQARVGRPARHQGVRRPIFV